MEEKEIRLDEVLKLETYLDHSQILAGPVRNYVSHRRRAIEADFPGAAAVTDLSPEDLRQKAIEHVKSKGYDQAAAEKIVEEWGPEKILAPESEEEASDQTPATEQPPVTQAPAEQAPAGQQQADPSSEQPPAGEQQS